MVNHEGLRLPGALRFTLTNPVLTKTHLSNGARSKRVTNRSSLHFHVVSGVVAHIEHAAVLPHQILPFDAQQRAGHLR